ncbi:unnamed protein product [Anisakis simplex]|uniref:Carbohydrate sulfotransferase n=1 Tax=Anisakis simplex TaxID=6269 RepID=A0A0M3J9I8_ANISI|nr:unnamed protein product [Anisakis simplex]
MLLRRKNLLRLCVVALVVFLVTMQLIARFWNQSAVKRGGVQVIAVDDLVVPPVNDVVPPVNDNKGSSHRDYDENNNDNYTDNGDGTRKPKIILQWTRVFRLPMPLASMDECSFTPEVCF